ncbi:hypothetical protein A3194_14130 [Candidatus Thiodiazotropha endoloripes]|nr:hypothetical protein A3194_14130 [Candidatus Thiodiazotropha endoloripes]
MVIHQGILARILRKNTCGSQQIIILSLAITSTRVGNLSGLAPTIAIVGNTALIWQFDAVELIVHVVISNSYTIRAGVGSFVASTVVSVAVAETKSAIVNCFARLLVIFIIYKDSVDSAIAPAGHISTMVISIGD